MTSPQVFSGRIVFVGCGAVAQCALPLLLDLIAVDPGRVSVLDFADNRERIASSLERGVAFHNERVTRGNYAETLARHLSAGDLLIDLAWNIETEAVLEWCRENKVLYINTSVELWDPYADEVRQDPRRYTLYTRQMALREMLKRWGDNAGATAIVDHGANPGLVSHFTKHALIEIASKIATENPDDPRALPLIEAIERHRFASMARLSGVKVIHISERDSQVSNVPKRMNEFVNTWSIEGLYEEGMAPAELGWGTHERAIPANGYSHESGPRNQICLGALGIDTWARSWVPSGEIVGMVIRHGEAYGISDRLTVWEGNRAVYRPTVHYVYCPSDAAIASLHELEMRRYHLQTEQRILSDEIVTGRDELGVLLMGHDYKAWWTGSLLDIEEARRLAPGQNATTLQVAISVVAGAIWAIKNPRRGLCLPDDIDHREILRISLPYLGPFVSCAVNWTPLDRVNEKFAGFGERKRKPEDCWQFECFLES